MLPRHVKIEENKYSVLELWPYLEKLIKDHEYIKQSPASSSEDEVAFTQIIETIEHMHKLGCEARDLNWWWPPNIPKKAHLARDTGNVFEQHFGPSKLPPLAGEKSLDYILKVIIPFMTFTASLTNEWWVTVACNLVSINFEEKVDEAKRLVRQNWEQIDKYQAEKHAKLAAASTDAGLVSVDDVSDSSSATANVKSQAATNISVTTVGQFAPAANNTPDASSELVSSKQQRLSM